MDIELQVGISTYYQPNNYHSYLKVPLYWLSLADW
jgi:hypothetical protein